MGIANHWNFLRIDRAFKTVKPKPIKFQSNNIFGDELNFDIGNATFGLGLRF